MTSVRTNRPFSCILGVAAMTLGTWLSPSIADAARPVVAISPVSGPKKAGGAQFEEALLESFSAQAIDVIRPKTLKKIAKKERESARSKYVADLAGADFLVSVRIKSRKRGYQLTAKLVNLTDEKTIESAKWNYRPTKKDRKASISENAASASAAMTKKFMAKLQTAFATMVGDKQITAAELP